MASSVILALVFSLGFVVGKRSSTRSLAPPPSDTLALLDKMAASEEQEEDPLTFHEALTGDEVPRPLPVAAAPKKAAKEAPAKEEDPPEEEAPASPAALKVAVIPPVAPPLPKPVGQVVKAEPAAKAPAPVEVKAAPKPAPAPEVKESPPPRGGGDYTLQLSAFQDKKEAVQFLASLKEAGFKPYMQTTTIPGQGIFFRVRMGSYKTWDDAVVAKQAFEANEQIIAYVTKK